MIKQADHHPDHLHRAEAGLQAKYIGHLKNSTVELLHTEVDKAELEFMKEISPKHPLYSQP
jgi:hypothetical protein